MERITEKLLAWFIGTIIFSAMVAMFIYSYGGSFFKAFLATLLLTIIVMVVNFLRYFFE